MPCQIIIQTGKKLRIFGHSLLYLFLLYLCVNYGYMDVTNPALDREFIQSGTNPTMFGYNCRLQLRCIVTQIKCFSWTYLYHRSFTLVKRYVQLPTSWNLWRHLYLNAYEVLRSLHLPKTIPGIKHRCWSFGNFLCWSNQIYIQMHLYSSQQLSFDIRTFSCSSVQVTTGQVTATEKFNVLYKSAILAKHISR